MPLVSSKDILQKAKSGGYAVGAFNIVNLEVTRAVLDTCERLKSPVILGVSEGALKYAGLDYLVAIARVADKKYTIPFALHLDHGSSFEVCKQVIDAGFTSVMIDASAKDFAENIAETKKVVDYAHSRGVTVEAELGRLAGIEDHVSVSGDAAFFTDPQEAIEFVEKSGCDSLAISVGTSHGAYKKVAAKGLAQNLIKQINQGVPVPLVLHGASSISSETVAEINELGGVLNQTSGVAEQDVIAAIKNGISKINVDSDLRLAFTAGVRRALKEAPGEFDIRKIVGPGAKKIEAVIEYKIKNVFGSENKA